MANWAFYQGVEVVDTQSNIKARHPRWAYDEKRMGVLKGATLLALADGIFVVVCDVCGYNGITGAEPYVKPEGDYSPILKQADSVRSHINGIHHPNKVNRRTSLYEDAVIKVAIKTYLKWKRTAVRGFAERACEELDAMGFKTYRGGRWTSGSLGSLVRTHIKEPKFKNIKAAPMDEEDHRVIAGMVRDAAARATGGRSTVADNVRITEEKPTKHNHSHIDFEKIISEQAAATQLEEEEVAEVALTSEPVAPAPILSFVRPDNSAPVKTLVVEKEDDPQVVNKASSVVVQPSPYEHIFELADGTPVFKFNGTLYAGKTIRGIEF